MIADVATNPTTDPNSTLYPPRVLHAATGPVVPIYFIADRNGVPTLFIGASLTYHELITEGSAAEAPQRYNDDEWRHEIDMGQIPTPPAWTQSFRTFTEAPQRLLLPTKPYGNK